MEDRQSPSGDDDFVKIISVGGDLAEYPRLRRTLYNSLFTVDTKAENLETSLKEDDLAHARQIMEDLEYAIPAAERLFKTKTPPFQVSVKELRSLIRCVVVCLDAEYSFDEADLKERLDLILKCLLETEALV